MREAFSSTVPTFAHPELTDTEAVIRKECCLKMLLILVFRSTKDTVSKKLSQAQGIRLYF